MKKFTDILITIAITAIAIAVGLMCGDFMFAIEILIYVAAGLVLLACVAGIALCVLDIYIMVTESTELNDYPQEERQK